MSFLGKDWRSFGHMNKYMYNLTKGLDFKELEKVCEEDNPYMMNPLSNEKFVTKCNNCEKAKVKADEI
jgi:hypothetical protein